MIQSCSILNFLLAANFDLKCEARIIEVSEIRLDEFSAVIVNNPIMSEVKCLTVTPVFQGVAHEFETNISELYCSL